MQARRRHARPFEVQCRLRPGETIADFQRMASEFYGRLVNPHGTAATGNAVVLFADSEACAEFAAARLSTTAHGELIPLLITHR